MVIIIRRRYPSAGSPNAHDRRKWGGGWRSGPQWGRSAPRRVITVQLIGKNNFYPLDILLPICPLSWHLSFWRPKGFRRPETEKRSSRETLPDLRRDASRSASFAMRCNSKKPPTEQLPFEPRRSETKAWRRKKHCAAGLEHRTRPIPALPEGMLSPRGWPSRKLSPRAIPAVGVAS